MRIFIIFTSLSFLITFIGCFNSENQRDTSEYIISKESGKIILAYKAFFDFLDTDKSWDNYNKMLLGAYPEVRLVHDRQLGWGAIDSLKFPSEVENYKMEDWEKFINQYSDEEVNILYDSIIIKAHKILKPVNDNPVNLCLFLPYGGCFIDPGDTVITIYISLHINPVDVRKIMAHEYAHNLHFQRRPEETVTLKREIVSEGFAVYFTTQILEDMELLKAIPFMSEASVKWCLDNEQIIKDSLYADLNDSTDEFMYKYIADGDFATPPDGFVQKTAYFAGCRIIENCINKGMKLEELCSLNSDEIIERSGYFN
ncbi:MAG: hypothetical protein JSV22_12325 [Bacteroidales bacterium]|nr:MAG: hypothetical protein JSV22_12325 [Bacteroidales bacterium]